MSSKKKHESKLGSWMVPLLILCLGVGLIILSKVKERIGEQTLQLSQELRDKYQENQASQVTPVWIYIEGKVDSEVESLPLVDTTWPVLEKKSVFLLQSATPGTVGNSILYGHNTKEVFGKLTTVQGGETILLTLSDGTQKRYTVRSLQEVPPTNNALLLPTTEEVLTIYTCSGFLDSQRFVVRAVPIP